MGLFAQLFGNSGREGLFRTEMQHLTNRVDQVERNKDRLAAVRELGVGAGDLRRLRLIFVTNTEAKARDLVAALESVGYEGKWTPPKERREEYLIYGYSPPVDMGDEPIAEWTDLMCDLAAAQDCEFSTWEL